MIIELLLVAVIWAAQDASLFEERRLATVPEGAETLQTDGCVLKSSPLGTEGIRFTQDRHTVGFTCRLGEKYFVMLGDKRGDSFDRIPSSPPTISRDGKNAAYPAMTGESWFVVVGNTRYGPYDQADYPVFSPDSKHVAFCAKKKNRWVVVRDGVESEPMDLAFGPIFDESSMQLAYIAVEGAKLVYRGVLGGYEGGKWQVFVDGKKGTAFDGIKYLGFSGASCIFSGKHGAKWYVVLNGQESSPSDDIGQFLDGPKGQIAAYVANSGGKSGSNEELEGGQWYVVRGNQKSKPYEGVWSPILSEDGRILAFQARRGLKGLVVVNDRESQEFDRIGSAPQFAPDGRTVLYTAQLKSECFVVSGESRSKTHDEVEAPTASLDGRTIAYAARDGNRWFAITGSYRSEPFDRVWNPVLSADGTKLGFGANRGGTITWKVVNLPR
jgi:hypothetical protein